MSLLEPSECTPLDEENDLFTFIARGQMFEFPPPLHAFCAPPVHVASRRVGEWVEVQKNGSHIAICTKFRALVRELKRAPRIFSAHEQTRCGHVWPNG